MGDKLLKTEQRGILEFINYTFAVHCSDRSSCGDDTRVRKSKNFPDSKIFTAKTFRIKRVNRDIDDFATNARKNIALS